MTGRDHMDRRLAEGLEQFMTAQIQLDAVADEQAGRAASAAPRRRTVWVTAAVGLVVVLLAVVAIRTSADRGDQVLPAGSPTVSAAVTPGPAPAVLGSAELLKRLPKPEYGRLLHTWTERDITGTGPFDSRGDTVVIAGVCNGGGAVNLTDITGKVHTLSCNGLRIQQPFWRFDLGGDEQPTATTDPFPIRVTVLKGTPTFVIRLWAVDPRVLRSGWYVAATSKDVPGTLRTCSAADLAPTGTVERLPKQSGAVVTITNRSSTDCAVRAWPELRYLDADGQQIGAKAGMSLDSSEGKEDRFHELPPARLAAGARGYLIVGLPTKKTVDRDEKERLQAAATASPAPTGIPTQEPCDPTRVDALRLTVSGAVITVPVTGEPAGVCRSEQYVYGGVDHVVAFRPSGE